MSGENQGFCVNCDSFTVSSGVEPDAENYQCPACGAKVVVGVDNAVLKEYLEII